MRQKQKNSEKFFRNLTEVSSFSLLCDIYIIEQTSVNDKIKSEKYIRMKKIVRLTEEELKKIMHESVRRALQNKAIIQEHVDYEREIRLAQKTLMKMSPLLTDLGLRLDGTRFRLLYQDVRDSLVTLNNAIIKHIKGGEK
jgi:hypothetical protein